MKILWTECLEPMQLDDTVMLFWDLNLEPRALALKAGLGDIEIDDGKLVVAFEEIAKRFRGGGGQQRKSTSAPDSSGAASGPNSEA